MIYQDSMISVMFAMAFWLCLTSIRDSTHEILSFLRFAKSYYFSMLSEHRYRLLILFLRLMTYQRIQFVCSERSTMISSILKEAATRRNGWNHLTLSSNS